MSGAASGIGRIVVIAHDRTREQEAREDINAVAPKRWHAAYYSDPSRFAEARHAAA
jgi:hypothetical protein